MLDPNLVKPPEIVKSAKYEPESTFTSSKLHLIFSLLNRKEIKERLFLGFAGLVVIVGLFVFFKLTGGFSLLSSKKSTLENLEKIPNTKTMPGITVNLPDEVQEGALGGNSFYYFVPGGVDIFAEGFFYDNAVDEFFKESPYYQMLLSSKVLMESHFAVFGVKQGQNWEMGVILQPKDRAKVEAELKELNVEGLKYKMIEDKLVLSTNGSIIDQIESSRSGNSKNLSLDPRYVKIRSSLPAQGIGMVLILSEKGREALLLLKEKTLSTELKGLVDEISKSSYNELVIY